MERQIKERAVYEAMSAHLGDLLVRRGTGDARTRLALLACGDWERLETLWPHVGTLAPQELLDEVEIALQLRTGERSEAHDRLAQHWEGWHSVDARSQTGVDLTAEPTPIGKLNTWPLTYMEVRQLRAHTELTPEAFGRLLGVSRQRVYVWEEEGTGSAHPTVSALLRLYLVTLKRVRG